MLEVQTKQFKEGTKEPLKINLSGGPEMIRCKTCKHFEPQEQGSNYGYCPFKEGAFSAEKLKCIHYE